VTIAATTIWRLLRRQQLHWRVAFRRQYFTGRRALQGSLDRFLQFYNYERTHRGYRLNGRTPATVFTGAAAA
jgi:hypothetical protein